MSTAVEIQVERVERFLRGRDELHALAMRARADLADAPAAEVVGWAAETFGSGLAVASSMTDGVLPHLVSAQLPGVDVLFLDSGYHFAATLRTRREVATTMPVTVINIRSRLSVAEQDAAYGPQLHDRDPGSCCRMRKVEPLDEQLRGYEAWASGLRRADGPGRAGTHTVDWDDRHGLVKINPIAAWTQEDVDAYIEKHDIVVNPLVSQGYPSIGCFPCTQRPASLDDLRSGRWAGRDQTECGIHV